MKILFVVVLLIPGFVHAQEEPPWDDPFATGKTQPVYIVDATINGIQIDAANDWIGIFDDTLIVGKSQVFGLPAADPIISYLEFTPPGSDPLSGARAGYPMMFKIWDANSNQDLDAEITEVVTGEPLFSEGTIVAVRINAVSQVQQYTLSMVINPAESGITEPTAGDHVYDEGTEVTVTATASSGWEFVSWTGDVAEVNNAQTKVIMDGNKTAIANLNLIPTYIRTSKQMHLKEYKIEQNFPNPFNPITVINYQLPMTNEVELVIYNMLGQKVTTLVSDKREAGYHHLEWDASGIASGVYYYRIKAGEFSQIKKCVILK